MFLVLPQPIITRPSSRGQRKRPKHVLPSPPHFFEKKKKTKTEHLLVPRLLGRSFFRRNTVCCLPGPLKAPGGRRHLNQTDMARRGKGEGREGTAARGKTGDPLPRPESTGMPTLAQSREEKEGTVLAGRGGQFAPWTPQGETMPGKSARKGEVKRCCCFRRERRGGREIP